MKFKIIFSENAKKDLISIVRYISEELLEPVTAEKLSQRILKAIKPSDSQYKFCFRLYLNVFYGGLFCRLQ